VVLPSEERVGTYIAGGRAIVLPVGGRKEKEGMGEVTKESLSSVVEYDDTCAIFCFTKSHQGRSRIWLERDDGLFTAGKKMM
jgi:hypothetical protein